MSVRSLGFFMLFFRFVLVFRFFFFYFSLNIKVCKVGFGGGVDGESSLLGLFLRIYLRIVLYNFMFFRKILLVFYCIFGL